MEDDHPYIHTYLEHIYNWNSQREGIRDQYMEWFEKCYHKMKETKNYDDYAKVPIPLFYDLNTQPTWDQFFNYRVKPFIDSSISQEEYEEYGAQGRHIITRPMKYEYHAAYGVENALTAFNSEVPYLVDLINLCISRNRSLINRYQNNENPDVLNACLELEIQLT